MINISYFCQFLANITRCRIVVPESSDITAYGTGRFALIGSRIVADLSDFADDVKPKTIVYPRKDLTHLKARF